MVDILIHFSCNRKKSMFGQSRVPSKDSDQPTCGALCSVLVGHFLDSQGSYIFYRIDMEHCKLQAWDIEDGRWQAALSLHWQTCPRYIFLCCCSRSFQQIHLTLQSLHKRPEKINEWYCFYMTYNNIFTEQFNITNKKNFHLMWQFRFSGKLSQWQYLFG